MCKFCAIASLTKRNPLQSSPQSLSQWGTLSLKLERPGTKSILDTRSSAPQTFTPHDPIDHKLR